MTKRREYWWIAASLALVASVILAGAMASVAFPGAREAIFEEDRVVEWLTVAAFAAAFVLGIRRMRTGEGRNLLLLAVTAFAGLAVLDELSFGERLLGWEAPRLFGTKIDAVHDLLRIAQKLILWNSDTPYLVALLAVLILCALAGMLVLWLLRRGWRLAVGADVILVGAAILCLAFAQGIDVDLKTLYAPVLKPLYVEEVLELGAGLLLAAFMLLGMRNGPPSRSAVTTPSVAGQHANR